MADKDFVVKNGLVVANGNISVTGTVDGRDVATDGTKLDGIESGATADQTASEILTAIKTVDGAASGLDADLLDGQQGTYYLDFTNATNIHDPVITLTGAVTGSGTMTDLGSVSITTTATSDPTLTLAGDVSGSATFTNLGNATLTVTVADDSHNHIISNVDGLQTALDAKLDSASYTAADVLTKVKTVDGAASGLDADLLDGQQGSYYLDWTNTTNKPDPVITLAGDLSGSVTLTDLTSGTLTATVGTLNQNTTGNAATATTLQTPRTIGGVSFDGSANINLPGVNTNGNQNTTGSAATLTTARAIQVSGAVTGTANFDGSAAINIVTTHTADPVITLTGAVTGSGTMTNLGSVSIATTATADPTLTLAGDATGSATFTNLGNATLTVAIVDDSHNHSSSSGNFTTNGTFYGLSGTTFDPSGGSGTDTSTTAAFALDSGSAIVGVNSGYIRNMLSWTSSSDITIGQGGTSLIGGINLIAGSSGNVKVNGQRVFAEDYHPNADTWTTARTITLGGVLSGSTSIDGSGNVTLTAAHTSDPVITLTGAVTGTGTMTNLGSVSIATTATADPTLTLAGDATGSATFTNLGNATLTVAVVDDSHNHSSSSGNFTVNGILTTTANTTIGGSLQIDGDLTVSGETVTINVTELAVEDNMIYLNSGSAVTNPDLGFVGNYNDGTYAHAGFFRDETDGYFKPFKGYTLEPDASAFIDTSHASFALADIQAANFRGALVGNASTATTLQTARTIGGVSFNGSANINLPGVNTAGNQNTSGNAASATTLQTARTIALSGAATGTATSFNGGANITIPVTALNASDLSSGTVPDARITGSYTGMTNLTGTGNADFAKFLGKAADVVTAPSYSWTGDINTGMWHPGADQIGFATGGTSRLNITTTDITSTLPISASTFTGALSGNATTATTLQTARTIGGVSFDGSANIDLPGVNTAGNQNTSGNATTASAWQTARTITLGGVLSGSVSLDGSGNVTLTAAHTSDPVITLTGAVTGSGTMTNLGSVSIATTATADPTLTLAGDATGSATFTNLGNATLTVAVGDDSHNHSIDTISDEHRLFNNMGDGHNTQTDFNSVSNFGARFIQGATNGPGTGSSQFYGFTLGLGNEYALSQYALQLAIPRTIATDKYLSFRAREAGTWSAWSKINAGQADTWTTARTLTLSGAVTGSVSINGSGNVTLATTATSDPTLTLAGDATGSATFTNLGNATLTVAVTDDSHNHSSSSGNFTVGGDLTVSGGQITNVGVSTRDKYRVWTDGTYAIGMQTGFTFGGLTNDFAMTFQMSNTDERGFWWGDSAHTNDQGAMSLTTNGKLSVAHSIRLGYGETDTTVPGATYRLDVSGNSLVTGTATAATFNATSTTDGGFQGIDADSLTAPSFTWTSDLNTGMWNRAADQIGFSTGGNDEFFIATTYTQSLGSSRAPIFYDSNDTAYYVDPNSLPGNGSTSAGARLRDLRVDRMWQGVPAHSGPILTYTLTSGGSGYTNGTYTNQVLSGGQGVYATFDFTVAGGIVTVATLTERGSGFQATNTIDIPALGGTGSGGLITVNTVRTVDVSLYNSASRIRLASSDTTIIAGQEIGGIYFNTRDASAGGGGDKAYILGVGEGTSGGGAIQFWTSTNGASATKCVEIAGNNTFRLFNAAGTFYHSFDNAPTANRTLTLPDATGTIALTSSSITGSAASLTTARTIALSGAATGTATSFNGTANITIPVTALNASNLNAGTVPDARITGSYTGMANLTGSGNVDFAKFLGNAADLVTAPSYSWTGDDNTGMWQPGADQIGFATNGVSRLNITTTAITSTLAMTAPTFTGALSGNATTATTWQTARTLTLSGAVTGSVSINGSGNVTLATTATADPTLTLAGDATGSATFTNLGNATLTVAVVNDSHTHDTRYYTETESDARFVRINTGQTWTGTGASALSFQSLDTIDTASGDQAALEVYQDTAGADAFMQFHIGGQYAKYFGLHGAINDFVVGGWTAGASYQRIFHDGYHPNADTWTTARTLSLTGAVTGSVSINGSGNVTLATTATSDPTLTLSGDLSGSATFTNLGNATLTAQIGANVVNANELNVTGNGTAGQSLLSDGDGTFSWGSPSASVAFNDLTSKTSGTGDYTTTGTFTAAAFYQSSTGTGNGFRGNGGDGASFPAHTWNNDEDTGMYRAGANQIGLTTAGVSRFVLNSTTATFTGDVVANSDIRLKKDIENITDALKKVNKLNGVNFTKIENDRRSTGLIAQDVQAVLPEAVAENEEGYLSVAYGNMVGLLVEAIKEQDSTINSLRNDVETLKELVNKLMETR